MFTDRFVTMKHIVLLAYILPLGTQLTHHSETYFLEGGIDY